MSRGIGKIFSEPSDRFRRLLKNLSQSRTIERLRHILIMETGWTAPLPTPNSFHTEVPYEQLPVQRIRQQQLDLDHPHRSAVPLLRRLRLLIPLKRRPAFGQVATFCIMHKSISRYSVIFSITSRKNREKPVAFFFKMWYNIYIVYYLPVYTHRHPFSIKPGKDSCKPC